MTESNPGLLVRLVRSGARSRELGVFAALVVLVLVISVLRYDAFLTGTNLFNLTRQIAFTAIVATGVLFVILTGGVDLSLGSTVGLTGFICGVALAMWHLPPAAAVGIGVLTGVLVGAFNGVIVSYIGVTPFIVTLGMLTAGRSIIYLCNNGANIIDIPEVFSTIGNGQILVPWIGFSNGMYMAWVGIPVPFVIFICVAIIAHIVLTYTTFGRRIYAIGGNEEATHLSGINVKAIKFFAYVVCSSLCSITGLLYIGRFRSAVANAGVGLELDAIAAAVIGGTSLMGGTGSVTGVVFGACIMGVVSNSITLLEIKSEAQGLIIGGIIIAAAILDVVRNRKSSLTPRSFAFVMSTIGTLALAALLFRSLYLYRHATEFVPAISSGRQVLFLVVCAIGMLVIVQTSCLVLIKKHLASGIGLFVISALACAFFLSILAMDFFAGRTILKELRLDTLLLLVTIGCLAGLAHASLKFVLAERRGRIGGNP